MQSDHSAVSLLFQSHLEQMKGPGFWKFNNCLLEDKELTKLLPLKINDVKHSQARQTRQKCNFGQEFIHWVQTFYADISSCIVNNQKASHFF